MTKKNTKSAYLRTPCCKAYPRVQLYQSAQIEINKHGEREQVWDFSDVDVEMDKIWCDECGNDLDLVFPPRGNCYLAVKRVQKLPKGKLKV